MAPGLAPLTPLPPAMDGLNEPLTPNDALAVLVQVIIGIVAAIAKSRPGTCGY